MSKVDIREVKDLCETSLYFLCTEILGYKDWDKVHDDVERMLNRPSAKKLIMLPRGHLKTAIVTKAYVTQCLLKDPNFRVLIASQVWDRSRDMLFEIKQFLSDKSDLPKIYGRFDSGRWRENDIVLNQRDKALAAPSIGTCGVESELTSAHFDLIICDDLCGLTNTQTREQRDKTKKFRKMLNSLLDPGSKEIDIGTRWHFDDYYSDVLLNEKEYTDIMVRQVVENGKIIFPKKFSLRFDKERKTWVQADEQCMDYINFLKQSMGSDFYSQYMNTPVDSEFQMFKRGMFQYWNRKPARMFVATTVDPALSFKESGDFTAIITCGMDTDGKVYVLDYIQGHWGTPSQIIDRIFEVNDRWHPQVIGIESNNWQKTLKWWAEKAMAEKGNPLPLTELRAHPREKKEFRIKALEPLYANKQVFHAHWMKDLEEQLLAFTQEGMKAKHDDLIDALAYQLELLVPGPEALGQEAPYGSWEWEVNDAHEKHAGLRDFLTE